MNLSGGEISRRGRWVTTQTDYRGDFHVAMSDAMKEWNRPMQALNLFVT
jgi:hypothetical protein